MSIAFKVFGYTLASIDVDLGGILGDESPTAAAGIERPVTKVVKGMSGWWVGKMMAR